VEGFKGPLEIQKSKIKINVVNIFGEGNKQWKV